MKEVAYVLIASTTLPGSTANDVWMDIIGHPMCQLIPWTLASLATAIPSSRKSHVRITQAGVTASTTTLERTAMTAQRGITTSPDATLCQ